MGRDWYFKARFVLGERVTDHRLNFTASIIRLLLKMIPQQRGQQMRKQEEKYEVKGQKTDSNALLKDLPFAA